MPVSNKALPDVRHTGRTSCPASAALWSNAGTVALVSQKPRPDGPTTFFFGGGGLACQSTGFSPAPLSLLVHRRRHQPRQWVGVPVYVAMKSSAQFLGVDAARLFLPACSLPVPLGATSGPERVQSVSRAITNNLSCCPHNVSVPEP